MMELGWQYEIKSGWTAELPHVASFWRTHDGGREEGHVADAKMISLAITLAALRACGVTEGEIEAAQEPRP